MTVRVVDVHQVGSADVDALVTILREQAAPTMEAAGATLVAVSYTHLTLPTNREV